MATVVAGIVLQELIRSQVIRRLGGKDRFGWRDFRSGTDWFGQGGLWSLHREHYPTSKLRFLLALCLATAVLAFAYGSYLQSRGIR